LEETEIEIWARQGVDKAKFNGAELDVKQTKYGTLIASLAPAQASIESVQASLPPLTEWKVANGLPETAADYDDSKWTGKFEPSPLP
jgi:hypothetical protein